MNDLWKQDPVIRSIIAQCSISTKVFAKTMFPERFTRLFPSVTQQIFDAIDDPNIQQVVIAAFRGFGKTSTMNMAYPAKKIVFREKKFIVPISCTATQAILHGENLKRKLQSSTRIKKFFGNVKTDVFAKDMWIGLDTMVLPRGAGQQVRGFLSDDYRPDLFVIDDLEDREAVKNPDRRKELREWFSSDVINAVDRSSKDWKIVVIGTVLHEDSLLVNLLQDPKWFKVELALCDNSYQTLHNDFMTNDAVKELAEDYARRGELHIFFMEYMNSVIPADAPFQQCFFKEYIEDQSMTFDRDVENVVIFDPAKTTNMASDYSAIVGIGTNIKSHNHQYKLYLPHERPTGLYIRDIVNERLHPEEAYEAVYQMCKRLGARVVGVEVTGLDEYVQYPIETFFTRKNFYPELVWLKSPSGRNNNDAKEKRVRGLVPFYRQGLVYHNKTACLPLEAQLLSFPRSKKWDVMDATAYVLKLLKLGDLYMEANEDEDPEKTMFDREFEAYESLENMEPENWRMI